MSLLLAVALASLQLAPCSFAIVHPAPTTIPVQGAQEMASRFRLVPQPDSPVVLTAIDFHDSVLDVAPGSYLLRKRAYTLEIMNVSNQPIEDIRASVRIQWPNQSGGTGTGTRYREVIQ